MIRTERSAAPVRDTRFENARLAALGIEPMRLSVLRAKVSPELFAQPEHIDFYMLMLVTSGRGVHTVDFVAWPLSPGTFVFVRPGQVQQWHAGERVEADLLLVAPTALPGGRTPGIPQALDRLALDDWPTCTVLGDSRAAEIGDDLFRLRRDFERFEATDLDVSLLRHELLILMLRLARHQEDRDIGVGGPSGQRETYRWFRRSLEEHFATEHALRFYAQRLGFAESTLSRACLAAEGRSAKHVIDRRVVLEAQRMLAHSTATVAEIAHALGFTESTNFVKFFRRLTGQTPLAFRAEASYSVGTTMRRGPRRSR